VQDFRSQICAFLDRALTEDLRQAGRNTTGLYSDPCACAIWHRRLYQAGWIAPAWPKAWGGAGWNEQQRAIFDAECIERDAPLLINAGIRSIGPLLIEMGAPKQQERYLPPILSGDELWCQGFSEPGAGSDLTAITSQGRVEGNQLILNGQKIWTTAAHLAQLMFALFRTDPQSRGSAGLTFVLLDMSTPGVSVRPIFDLRGEHEFNQVFFDDAVVDVENCVGAIDEGWRVAKRLMTLARANNSPASHTRRILRQIRQTLPDNISSTLRMRLAALEIELKAFAALEQAGPGADAAAIRASLLKIRGSELKQRACELALDIADAASEAQFSLLARQYLGSRAASIYSGTNEIQRNLVARALVR
jgi:acyl-CoA dehydrogenase